MACVLGKLVYNNDAYNLCGHSTKASMQAFQA